MTLFFDEPTVIGGKGKWNNNPFRFYDNGEPWILGSGKVTPDWKDIILSGNTALTLVNAKANGLNYLKLFGGTEQRNLPAEYIQVNYVTNTAQTMVNTGFKFNFSKKYEIELKARGVTGPWYILQAREHPSSPISGVSGSSKGNVIGLNFNGTYVATSQISRVIGHIYYVKGTINNGNMTLYVKDETAGTEETVTGTYTVTTGQSVDIGLFGNIAGNYVNINSDVYFVSIKEDGNYIMDYVPCRQSATAGFYDKVTNTFKTTTNLVAGTEAVPSPDTPMDIVCNNGVLKFNGNLFVASTAVNNNYIKDDGDIAENQGSFYSALIPAKPNTEYTFYRNLGAGSYPRIHAYDSNGNWLAMIAKGKDTSSLVISGTTTATTAFIRVSGKIAPDCRVYLTNYPYSEIYTDGTVETVEVNGKNLFDVDNNLLAGYYINTTTGILTRSSDGSSSCFKDFLPSKPNITYTMSRLLGKSTALRMWAYDKDKNPISLVFNSELGAKEITGTTPNDTAYIRCSFGSIPQYSQNVQLEQGSTATTYEPYFDGGSFECPMLLSVGNYKDEFILEN